MVVGGQMKYNQYNNTTITSIIAVICKILRLCRRIESLNHHLRPVKVLCKPWFIVSKLMKQASLTRREAGAISEDRRT